jgi:hypothetical protein
MRLPCKLIQLQLNSLGVSLALTMDAMETAQLVTLTASSFKQSQGMWASGTKGVLRLAMSSRNGGQSLLVITSLATPVGRLTDKVTDKVTDIGWWHKVRPEVLL